MNKIMNKPHKHCELIKAWADGAKIQFFNYFTRSWKDIKRPDWSYNIEYRIKPQKLRYRVALINKANNGFETTTADTDEQAKCIESWTSFIDWITDWTEVEV